MRSAPGFVGCTAAIAVEGAPDLLAVAVVLEGAAGCAAGAAGDVAGGVAGGLVAAEGAGVGAEALPAPPVAGAGAAAAAMPWTLDVREETDGVAEATEPIVLPTRVVEPAALIG